MPVSLLRLRTVLAALASGSALTLFCCTGCNRSTPSPPPPVSSRAARLGVPLDTEVVLKGMRRVDDFEHEIAQFQTVFWDPEDTVSLRELIREQHLTGQTVLEIGTGTGLISLCCLEADAASVVATDINPVAIVNAVYNAELLGLDARFETRLVPMEIPSAYAVVRNDEKFDLIISNPPWENGTPQKLEEYAFYDEGFALLDSLFANVRQHLNPGGKVWLAYGCVDAIRTAQRLATEYDLELTILDDRQLDELEELFLPGMLLEVVPKMGR